MTVVTGTPAPETFKRIVKALILHESGDRKSSDAELSLIKKLVGKSGSLLFEYLSQPKRSSTLISERKRKE